MRIGDEEVGSLRTGDIFYECESGLNIEAEVISAPVRSESRSGLTQWRWVAKNTQTGEEIKYLLTEGLSYCGPRLYRSPQYARICNGELVFPLLGGL